MLSLAIGYIFCPLSCGFSFLLPNLCISDAEASLQDRINYFNTYRLQERGLEVKLIKKCSTSWIELRVKNVDDFKDTEEDTLELMAKPRNSPDSEITSQTIYSSETMSAGIGGYGRDTTTGNDTMIDIEYN